METCSPSKRRALAPLNSNALASPKKLFKDTKPSGEGLGSPVKLAIEARKRLFEVEGETSPSSKKACLGRDEDALSRSLSPESSSLFDTSANDASWATATTEPDAIAPIAAAALEQARVTRPRALTREQAREKVEILRLRLGLANYKVRTGQTAVPLADLQPRPMPRTSPRVVRVQSPGASSSSSTQDAPQSQPGERSEDHTETDPELQQQISSAEDEDEEDDDATVADTNPADDDAPPPTDVSEPQAITLSGEVEMALPSLSQEDLGL